MISASRVKARARALGAGSARRPERWSSLRAGLFAVLLAGGAAGGGRGANRRGAWRRRGRHLEADRRPSQRLARRGRAGRGAGRWPVLLTGAGPSADRAELYDPATGTWSAAANLPEGRRGHVAVRPRDGRVLLTGGQGNICCFLATPPVESREGSPMSGWLTLMPRVRGRAGWRRLGIAAVGALVWSSAWAGPAAAAQSEDAVLVKDILPGFSGSNPIWLGGFGSTLFFAADDGVIGHELWRSDGTAAGTTLVKDINRGSGGSAPRVLTDVAGTLFFRANDGANGIELWRTDGTAAGTTLVKDINRGSGSSIPAGLTDVAGTLMFYADDGAHGAEPWRSDGTAKGTTLVKDINPGAGSSTPSGVPLDLINVGGTLLFNPDDGTQGIELWRSDGTAGGTTLVKDINPGAASSAPAGLTVVGGTVFFRAGDVEHGAELWRTDGTAAGTTLVKDIFPGGQPSEIEEITNVNGTAFFRAFDDIFPRGHGFELWRSDGTAAGTTLVKDIFPGSADNPGASSNPEELTAVGGILFFRAFDRPPFPQPSDWELWRSDGTANGTFQVKDINPGLQPSFPDLLTNVNGTLFFNANDGALGKELWKVIATAPPA
jgi:ELWxxDGT repeat protein